eukprot:TRINITY_DN2303_c0_g1_i1.p1 TRINITY_DN2303_c0_g1~~TRINITY_DN2303_c0_g1_i1.p1  ORF type:complete len:425 (+),score=135.27 TRINITY_DN2303_c0_g1_i1:51-1325(+)
MTCCRQVHNSISYFFEYYLCRIYRLKNMEGEEDDFVYEEEIQEEIEVDPNDLLDGDIDDQAMMEDGEGDGGNEGEEEEDEGANDDVMLDDAIHTFSHDGSVFCATTWNNLIVTGGEDDKAIVWNMTSGEKLHELSEFKESVTAAAFNHNGELFAAGSLGGYIGVYNSTTAELVAHLEGTDSGIEWIAWHPKGNIVLAGSEDACAYMWTSTGTMMGVFAGHAAEVGCGGFSPDGKKIVTGSGDGSVKIWNPKDQQCISTFSGHSWHSEGVTSLAFKSDSTVIASGSTDSSVCLGSIATNKALGKLVGHTNSVECLKFSNQQPFLFSGSMDGTLRIWDLNQLQPRLTCVHDKQTEEHGVTRIATTNQAMVITSCTDGIVRAWDERTGSCVRRFQAHSNIILDLTIAKDGSIITTSDDNTCRVFTLD